MSGETLFSNAAEAARLREFLDAAGLGTGEPRGTEIGAGHSNLTFLVERGKERFVLRRPPRGQLSASANDVLRESRVLEALAATAVPVPRVLARCAEADVIGAPFFLMSLVDGCPVNDGLPAALERVGAPSQIATELIGALAELHATDPRAAGLDVFGKPSGYLERQLRRFGALLEENATRPLPDLELVGPWLERHRPRSSEVTFVHGDYRLGNLMWATPLRLAAVLDWEMSTLGDPLADLGYLTATWAEPGDAENPMLELSRLTARSGFPNRAELARLYRTATGRSLETLGWYQVLALWKAAIFLEGSFRRYRAGDSADAYFAGLDRGVPALARAALDRAHRLEDAPGIS